MNIKLASGVVLLSSLLLAACGGGGGGGTEESGEETSVPGVSSAQGVYEGNISNGNVHLTLVTDDDRYYTLYGTTANDVFTAAGLVQGNGTSNNGTFTSTNLKDFYADGTVVDGSLSASYNPQLSFNGTVTEGSSNVTFTGSPLVGTNYAYNTAANLANIVGAWPMNTLQGESVALNIASSGAFSATSDGGCAFSGTIAPRASGKNVFDVNLTFGAAPCVLAGQSANGVAIEYMIDGQRELVFAGTTTDRSNGTAMFGVR